jgi:signal transduction histidine kinase/ActR/RegA family two-component response regulator
VDERGRVVYLNAAARATLGDRVTVGSDGWRQALTVFAADGVTPIPLERWSLSRALSGENVDNEEYLVRPPAAPDQLIPLVCSARPIRDEAGNMQGAVVVSRDFSEIRETERQLRQSQKMEAIGQLTGGIAHDLNNILTVITGTIDILINGVADRPNLATIARMIDAAATRAATLTRQLLAFARRQPLYPRDTDVNALVIDAARLLRPLLGAQIKIESMLADDLWQAMIDQTQLSTALLNLALNARDAMPGGGTLTFETRNVVFDQAYVTSAADARPGDYVMIAVGDTGSGIPPAIRDKVFEPFFTTKEVGKGTGLGLSIVYGFIKQSRGHVEISSEEGCGTSVVLYLPRGRTEAGTAADEAKMAEPQGGSETVLVVEDDHLVRKYVVAQLESLGYATLAASTGAEALALMDQGVQFDLLFTDLIMPGGLSGQELAARVRQRRPASRILYTSGYADTALPRGEPFGSGVSVLSKPYRKRELAQRLRQALGDPPPVG